MKREDVTHRRRRWGIVTLCGAAIVALAGGWWAYFSRPIWTDGLSLRVASAAAAPRTIVWTPPELLASSFNADGHNYEPATSPDGGEIFFVRGKPGRNADIYRSQRLGDNWTAPQAVESINTDADELGPRPTADGRFLVFYSNRQGGVGGYDLWAAARDGDRWSEPFNLGPTVNSEYNEFCPSPAPDGRHLYFSTNRKSAAREQKEAWQATIRQSDVGDYDIFVAELDPAFALKPPGPVLPYQWAAPTTQPATAPSAPARLVYQPAVELPLVNSAYHDGAGAVSPLGDFFYFASNRPGGYGKFDLYRCRLRDGQPFGAAENLGPQINTPQNEADPQSLRDGFVLMFSSDRGGKYDLLASESREVFAQRLGRPLPRLGWSVWVLLGALILLIPLLIMLRGWSDRQLSLIQRCLLVSILMHVLLTIALSFMVVTGQVIKYARNELGGGGMSEFSVNLGASRGTDISLAIRQVSSGGDAPVGPMPTPAGPQQAATNFEAAMPASVEMNLPPAGPAAATASMLVPVANKPSPPVAAASKDSVVAPTLPTAAGPALSFAGASQVSQTERQPAAFAGPSVEAAPVAHGAGATAAAAPVRADLPPALASPASASEGNGLISAAAVGAAQRMPAGGSAGEVIQPRVESAAASGPELSPMGATGRAAPVRAAEAMIGAGTAANAAPAGARQEAVAAARGAPAAALASAAAPTASPAEMSAASDAGAVGAPAAAIRPSVSGATPIAAAVASSALPADAAGLSAPAGPDQKITGPASAPTLEGALAKAAGQLEQSALAAAPARQDAAGDMPASGPAIGVVPTPAAQRAGASADSQLASLGPTTRPMQEVPTPLALSAAAATDVPVGELTAGPQLVAAKIAAGDARGGAVRVEPAPSAAKRVELASAVGAPPSVSDLAIAPPTTGAAANRPMNLSGGGPPVRGVEGAIVRLPIGPEIGITQPQISAPAALFQRAPEQRQPLVEKMGGTKQSEDAVARGLAYLARQQEPDGRWTRIHDEGGPGRRELSEHDPASTGLAVLAFLAADHTPARAGPYRRIVAAGMDWLIAAQESDGDLRGSRRGGGADAGNMYDQGIATLALSEAALMTGDERYKLAAERGVKFIVAAQDRRGGGWRYLPSEAGDTSVFGWQIMALHSAEQLGIAIPDFTRDRISRYIRSATSGRENILAGYQAGHGASEPMTAEMLFARILLGEQFTPQQTERASRFMVRGMSERGEYNLYYWYYASLCLMQLQSDQWKDWNQRTRELLIALQRKDGPAAGSWDPTDRWGGQGGRIYSTAMATLTLEVYYRYLPIQDRPATGPSR